MAKKYTIGSVSFGCLEDKIELCLEDKDLQTEH
jgi:hypothetical protein